MNNTFFRSAIHYSFNVASSYSEDIAEGKGSRFQTESNRSSRGERDNEATESNRSNRGERDNEATEINGCGADFNLKVEPQIWNWTLAKARLATSIVGHHHKATVLTCHLRCRLPPQSHDTFIVDLHCEMDTIAILVCYNGKWVTSKKMCTYEGGDSKDIIVSRNITFSELLEPVDKIVNRQALFKLLNFNILE
ncbi:hypothetical protein L3X38_041878 [Prunus dulcis]|uniref:Uncharacterized protein n=1 Tax=Prunus dulcis TaxID=3755 RepID=A0AAD4UTV5_PRUDU|nr:hypothetical protein L3X38_041878 [Prunus dulcis]